jgi:hypothetical protein
MAKAKARKPRAGGLKFDPRNARLHPERNERLIRQSLEEVGPFRSIAVDGDDVIRAGEGVFRQARALGLKVRVVEAGPDELIAVKRSDLKGTQAERAALLDNRAGELSRWDPEVLRATDEALLSGLFQPGEIDEILGGVDAADVKQVSFEAGKKPAAPQMKGLLYRIIVDCDGEKDQARLLGAFEKQGLKCRPLIS